MTNKTLVEQVEELADKCTYAMDKGVQSDYARVIIDICDSHSRQAFIEEAVDVIEKEFPLHKSYSDQINGIILAIRKRLIVHIRNMK